MYATCFSELLVLVCRSLGFAGFSGLLDLVRVVEIAGAMLSAYVLVPSHTLSFRRRPSASHQCGFRWTGIAISSATGTGLEEPFFSAQRRSKRALLCRLRKGIESREFPSILLHGLSIQENTMLSTPAWRANIAVCNTANQKIGCIT